MRKKQENNPAVRATGSELAVAVLGSVLLEHSLHPVTHGFNGSNLVPRWQAVWTTKERPHPPGCTDTSKIK